MPRKRIQGSFDYDPPGFSADQLRRAFANRLYFSVGKDTLTATDRDWFQAAALVTREQLMERWMRTMRSYYDHDVKRVYYLSLEFLIGRVLNNSLLNLGLYHRFDDMLDDLGLDAEQIERQEPDAALGNGGLGRLAACFLDSMATLRLPGYGYGIRYDYGMFTQKVQDGVQIEHPDNWLRYGNPWEFPRPEVLYQVKFHGRSVAYTNEHGQLSHQWIDTDDVMAMAYDTPIPGYGSDTVNNMRLWSAKASRDFDLRLFNEGDYIRAVENKTASENLSKVLYPSDSTQSGRELRLKQQYFFVSASLQDILFRYRKYHPTFTALPDKVAIQLNDTHPSLAIAELMRTLVDVHMLEWDEAWDLTVRTFAYTNHTLLPEALETWPVPLMQAVLPRHLRIIYEINHRFLQHVRRLVPGDVDLLRRVSLIDEHGDKRVRMAHLAIVGSHRVNGVAALHTQLMKETIFRDFDRLFPDRIISITNGITPRRWLNQANPALAALITAQIGNGWQTDLARLEGLGRFAGDAGFQATFVAVKHANKEALARVVRMRLGIELNVQSLFDVQVKRIHEYKRQLLNVLHVVTLYRRLIDGRAEQRVPRTVIFGGKAAPSYFMAKLIIRLIHDVGDVVNHDPRVGDRLKVVFVPNYDVSTAAVIIPAADLSEQISTAGTEASGTGNMKLALNGALTIGTLDGANVEIRDAVGADNIFIFGLTAQGAARLLRDGYRPWDWYNGNPELTQVLDMIGNGFFSPGDAGRYRPLVDALLLGGDPFLVLADYADYVKCQETVDALYSTPAAWTEKAILNVARMGWFSSDRTIGEYAEKIWGVEPVES
ncbi:MAG: glycogen/starch/alpha-glucan phosphorylase [Burkholderiales bacterium]|nr:glycogen/starch/alpha-glucan phosphorylase [Burkholderiales bacterium]